MSEARRAASRERNRQVALATARGEVHLGPEAQSERAKD
jgi:hypothetical protein